MSTGLLVLRVVVGLLLAGHGMQKLLGWFGGHGLTATGGFFHQLGHRPGTVMAAVAGLSETGGGLLLAAGLVTPLAAAIIVGTMIVAGSAHWPKLWATQNGFEPALLYLTVASAFGFTGPGRYSIDAALGWSWTPHWAWGVGAVVAGVASAAATLRRRARIVRAEVDPLSAARIGS